MKPVIVLLAIFFLISILRKRSKPLRKPRPGSDEARPKRDGEEMVFDTVCNSYIPVSSAISLKVDGELEYFCSEECREKFRQGKA
ncbi:MAG: hypothetical protein HY893_10305 [Deltaproteobacteria bacterium]|nr:hypothetical protein [Deltaproteobacteria bacterium]